MADIKPRVKIQVGVGRATPREATEVIELVEEDEGGVAHQASANATMAQTTQPTRGLRLADLCSSSYVAKFVPRSRPKRGDVTTDTKPCSDGNMYGKETVIQLTDTTDAAGEKASSSGGPKRSRHEAQITESTSTAPQVEWINGRIVVKESSLLVQEPTTQTEAEYEEVTEGTHATATYRSFQRKQRNDKWGLEETRLFFTALRQCGTEFSLMQSLFPGRTRKQLKLKFLREEREHPQLVRETLRLIQPLDTKPFEIQFAKHPSEATGDRPEREEHELLPDLPEIFNSENDPEDEVIDI